METVKNLINAGRYKDIKASFFDPFIKGKHITWQQWIILEAIGNQIVHGGRNIKLSISSGHGIGKSVCLAWLIIWFLFCYKNAQVPTTAPTAEQMHDILWKELSLWLKKLPEPIGNLFDWSAGYLRITESPETWFARAKTARKENPEALAGVHSDYVMVIADEASGVPDEIFNTAEGAMTGPFVIVVLISNPTRLTGYFYDTHHSDSRAWTTMQFDSTESPIVDEQYVNRIIEKHGRDSDEYCIRVTGRFPKADSIDDQGYVPLVVEADLKQVPQSVFVGDLVLGIDPAGMGRDETIWVARDSYKAQVLASEKVSTAKSIAEKTLTLMQFYNIRPENVFVDAFGTGANVSQEMALEGYRINPINVGDKPYDARFVNLRSEIYWKCKEWIRSGGELVQNDGWSELLYIRYKNTLGGRLQIMPKIDMKKRLGKSPDHADALSLTFIRPPRRFIKRELKKLKRNHSKRTLRFKMA